jgi:Transposase and inactivated derivatives
MPDHVHMFVESDPGMAPAKLAAQFQSYTSHILWQEFGYLRSRLPSLWSRSYYIGCVGHVWEATLPEKEVAKPRFIMISFPTRFHTHVILLFQQTSR